MGSCGSKSGGDSGQQPALGAEERQRQRLEQRQQQEEQRRQRKQEQRQQKQARQQAKQEQRQLEKQQKELRRQHQPSFSCWPQRPRPSISPLPPASDQQFGLAQSENVPEISQSGEQGAGRESTGPGLGQGQISSDDPDPRGHFDPGSVKVKPEVTQVDAAVSEGWSGRPPYSSSAAQGSTAAVRTRSVRHHQSSRGRSPSPVTAPSSLPSTEVDATHEPKTIIETRHHAKMDEVPLESEHRRGATPSVPDNALLVWPGQNPPVVDDQSLKPTPADDVSRSLARPEDGQEVTVSTSSTKVQATPTPMSTTETLATPAPLTQTEGHARLADAQGVPFPSPPSSTSLNHDVGTPASNSSAETIRQQTLARARLDGTGGTQGSVPPTTGTPHAISPREGETVSMTKRSDGPSLEDIAVWLKLEGKDSPSSLQELSDVVEHDVDADGGPGLNQPDGLPSRLDLTGTTPSVGYPIPPGQPHLRTHQNEEAARQPGMRDPSSVGQGLLLGLPGGPRLRPAARSSPAIASPHTRASGPANDQNGARDVDEASSTELLKKSTDQPPTPPAQSQSSRISSSPNRSSSSPPLPRGRRVRYPSPSTRTPAETFASVSTEPAESPPTRTNTAMSADSGISQLSREAVGDYIVNPVGSRLTLGSVDTDMLDQFDFSGRLIDVEAAASGGLSDVKKGRIDKSDTIVAIKVLRTQNMAQVTHDLGDPQLIRLRKRMARELRIWLFLRHPRILESLGFAFLEDQPCLLSPWCENGNAREYVARNPTANRMDLVIQVAEGLIYLHSRNPAVVHADLKPLNILINDGGDAVICDFGISRLSGEANTGLTTSQDAFMSLRYSAPEILQNQKPTTNSDVYGFGCVALELFTDRYPQFGVITTVALINHVINGPMSNPAQYPKLSDASPLWVLFRKCWATNPEERPSIQEVHDELVRIQSE